MKKNPPYIFLFFLLFIVFVPVLHPQASTGDPTLPSTRFDTTGMSQWVKDLRRAEIVAFGSFPFAYFFSNFGFDLYRCGNNGWNMAYAPWPLKGAGAIEQTQEEKIRVLGIAAGSAVFVALVDFGIERVKRSRRDREARLAEGTPIIIRKPLDENVPAEAETELPETETP